MSPRNHIRLNGPIYRATPKRGVRKIASPIPKEKRITGRVYIPDGTGSEKPWKTSSQTVSLKGVA